MGAVLVHIDLDGDRPHPSSLAALHAGRAVATSWGATLYAALVVHDNTKRSSPDGAARVPTTKRVPDVSIVQPALARAGADKVVVAVTDAPVAPLWAVVGAAWQGVLDHLRPRLVLFGADAPSASELGPRTGARIGARLLPRARAVGSDQIELRDRDGGYVRASDGGAAVVLIGAAPPSTASDDDVGLVGLVGLVVLVLPGGGDPRIELAGTAPAELSHTLGSVIALGEDVASDPEVVAAARQLASLLGAHVIGSAAVARSGAIAAGAIIDRHAALAPGLCISVGTPAVDLAGTTSSIRIAATASKDVDGGLTGLPTASLTALADRLDRQARREDA